MNLLAKKYSETPFIVVKNSFDHIFTVTTNRLYDFNMKILILTVRLWMKNELQFDWLKYRFNTYLSNCTISLVLHKDSVLFIVCERSTLFYFLLFTTFSFGQNLFSFPSLDKCHMLVHAFKIIKIVDRQWYK